MNECKEDSIEVFIYLRKIVLNFITGLTNKWKMNNSYQDRFRYLIRRDIKICRSLHNSSIPDTQIIRGNILFKYSMECEGWICLESDYEKTHNKWIIDNNILYKFVVKFAVKTWLTFHYSRMHYKQTILNRNLFTYFHNWKY
jgi:hypothetical protein